MLYFCEVWLGLALWAAPLLCVAGLLLLWAPLLELLSLGSSYISWAPAVAYLLGLFPLFKGLMVAAPIIEHHKLSSCILVFFVFLIFSQVKYVSSLRVLAFLFVC
ncbi:hypothetical protein HanHA300_Chr02g0047381 [Helianthus annuus]|nr:hypothetical protein HanHA300_Chr02g0047381 [Helianthus annuus]KAJ0618249.1 hypothetical protein HanHA89_Chr02g0051011 [Helianthus annuus]KAJ0776711.1 hypothetical protein HanLR1_Chr02g0048771 [Helianthus annuus]